jgi:hypothetical protein
MASWKKVIVSGSNLSQLNNDAGYLTSATVGNFVSGSSDSARTNLNSITGDELSQLLNINSVTISNTQWGYLGAQNQGVATTDSVTFAGVSAPLTGNVTGNVTGTADTASYVAGANVAGDISGNAGTATTLATGRNFSITGEVTASNVSFDGSGNVALSATIGENVIDTAHLVDGAVDGDKLALGSVGATNFAASAKTAISGAFTSDSSSLASRITTLEGSDFVYDLQVSDGGSGNGAISDSETLTIQGTSNEVTVAYADGSSAFTIGLPDAVTVTNVTASLKGDVDGTAGNASDLHSAGITSGEASQIANINSVTISNTQWGYLGAADQGIATTSSPSFTNLTVTGDLTVEGSRTELQVTNLSVEDQFILLNSGSTTGDIGIVFGGGGGTANQGSALWYDNSADVFKYANSVAGGNTSDLTSAVKIGAISEAAGVPLNANATSFQGVGTIHVNTSTEDIWIYS